jgi:predicted DCC family thiol-disulfide oxidoreductase YuxK
MWRIASLSRRTRAPSTTSSHGVDPDDPATLLVVEGARVRRDSDAILHIYETRSRAGTRRRIPASRQGYPSVS